MSVARLMLYVKRSEHTTVLKTQNSLKARQTARKHAKRCKRMQKYEIFWTTIKYFGQLSNNLDDYQMFWTTSPICLLLQKSVARFLGDRG
jgi:hypothetical protein